MNIIFRNLEDVDAYRYQYGIGCLTDQLLGQFMAQAAGLGYVLPKAHVKKALQSIYKYNFKECMDDVPNVQRTYALMTRQDWFSAHGRKVEDRDSHLHIAMRYGLELNIRLL